MGDKNVCDPMWLCCLLVEQETPPEGFIVCLPLICLLGIDLPGAGSDGSLISQKFQL